MKQCHRLYTLTAILLFLTAISASAANLQEMRQQMWTWSQLEAVIHEATHSPFPGSVPAVDPKEAYECIDQAQKRIAAIIASIATAEELAHARAMAREFIDMGDKEEDVGHAVNRLLDRQEKFMQAHQY